MRIQQGTLPPCQFSYELLMLSHERRLYLHPNIIRGGIFLPPLACGFTLPQGDSRWRSPISIKT